MTQPYGYGYTRAPDPRAEYEAKKQAEARARQAVEAEQRIKVEEAARFEAKAREVPSALFADDPEIQALQEDCEVKQRQRPILTLANPGILANAIAALKARMQARTLDAMVAAVEDAMEGDETLQRAVAVQRQVENDARKLGLLTTALERLSRFGFSQLAREREQGARLALEAALMERKRQYVREQPPDTAQAPSADPATDDVIEI